MGCIPIVEGQPYGVAVRIKDGTKGCGESGCETSKFVTVTYSDGSEGDMMVSGGCCECVEFQGDPYITYRNDGVVTAPCDYVQPEQP